MLNKLQAQFDQVSEENQKNMEVKKECLNTDRLKHINQNEWSDKPKSYIILELEFLAILHMFNSQ